MSGLVLTPSREREEALPPPVCQCVLEILSAPSPLLHCREGLLS